MFCKKCGCEIGEAKFCPSCGAMQADDVGGSQAGAAQTNAYSQPYTNNQPYSQAYVPPVVKSDMSVGDWIIALLISCIPLIGFIVLIVWAAGSAQEKPSRKNWAIAQLILTLISWVIAVIVIFAIFAVASK